MQRLGFRCVFAAFRVQGAGLIVQGFRFHGSLVAGILKCDKRRKGVPRKIQPMGRLKGTVGV